MNKKYSFLILLILALLYFFTPEIDLDTITANIVKDVPESYLSESGNIELYFCPHDDCENALVDFIDSANRSIHCALFDIGLKSVQDKLLEKAEQIDVQIVTDNDYLKKFNHSFVKADSWGLMHNKFCIIDGIKVSTGSMNPTDNGAHKNNNNLLLIQSVALAGNYEAEFQEMWNGTFKKGDPVLNPLIELNGTIIKNYFCPEDHCADMVKEELKKAEDSIYFMIFSFTHDGIANVLLLKHLDNLSLHGVMEARQISEYSKFKVLNYQGIDVIKDGNPNNLHHKVFIIDGKTVITGSFNPSSGGDSKNDENILIIENAEIAQKFMEEFARVYAEGQ